MEDQYRHHAQGAVVTEGNGSQTDPADHGQEPLAVIGPAGQQAEEQGQHHILVEGENGGAHHHQIEGDLGNGGEDQQALAVGLKIVGVVIPLGRLEGENGEGHAAHIGHPVVARYHRGPEMVQKHQHQGQDAQVGGGTVFSWEHSV